MADLTVRDIYLSIDSWAPFGTQLGFDNAGFLVGAYEQKVERVLVALDITREVVEEAVQAGAQLIVSHHPVIFQPVRSVTDQDPTGQILMDLIRAGISAVCAHTNLDAARGGVNDCLAQRLGLEGIGLLQQEGTDAQGRPYGIGRTGQAGIQGLSVPDYAAMVKAALGAAGVRYVDAGIPVKRVAVGGGSCGSMLEDALRAGCDTFVTADVKYDQFLQAKAMGITLMDAGHFPTELPGVMSLYERFLADATRAGWPVKAHLHFQPPYAGAFLAP